MKSPSRNHREGDLYLMKVLLQWDWRLFLDALIGKIKYDCSAKEEHYNLKLSTILCNLLFELSAVIMADVPAHAGKDGVPQACAKRGV